MAQSGLCGSVCHDALIHSLTLLGQFSCFYRKYVYVHADWHCKYKNGFLRGDPFNILDVIVHYVLRSAWKSETFANVTI